MSQFIHYYNAAGTLFYTGSLPEIEALLPASEINGDEPETPQRLRAFLQLSNADLLGFDEASGYGTFVLGPLVGILRLASRRNPANLSCAQVSNALGVVFPTERSK